MPNEEKTYLGILKFDPKLLTSLPGKYLRNVRLMMLFLLTITILGVGSYISMPRTLYPEIEIPMIIVSTVLPGAGPADVESLVTIPIEREIKREKGIDRYYSSSQDNVSVVAVEFTSDVPVDKALDQIQKAVDRVTDLPEDATEPNVSDIDFENIPVLNFALVKKGDDDIASLNRLAETLKDRIEDLSYVDRAEIYGLDEREIQVLIKPEMFREKSIDPMTLSQSVKNALNSYPAGSIMTDSSSFSFTIDQPAQSLSDLRDIPVYFGGESYRLSDIAEVSEKSKPNQAPSFVSASGVDTKRAVVFTVYKTRAARIDDAEQQVLETLDTVISEHQDQFETKIITDYAEMINDQFDNLIGNFYQTLALVFFSMFLIYGIRQAAIASVAIPFSLLIVFGSMSVFGISLNFITIFSLLIALGLFVDNAVVIIEAYTTYYKSGKFTPLQTAILVWKDFFIELFSINLLTMWAFLPLLITSGIIGEFIKPLPIIVSIAMMGSVVVAFLFTLPSMMILSEFSIPKRVKYLLLVLFGGLGLGAWVLIIPQSVLFIPTLIIGLIFSLLIWILRKELFSKLSGLSDSRPMLKKLSAFAVRSFDKGFVSLDSLSNGYRKIVTHLLSSRSARIETLIIITAFTVMSYLLPYFGFVKNEFFPKSDMDEVYLQLELAEGTNKDITTKEAMLIMDQIKDTDGVDFITLQVKASAGDGFSIGSVGSNKALFTMVLKDAEGRDQTSMVIAQGLRDQFASYSRGEIQIVEDSGGPPAGADLEIQLSGDDLDKLNAYATQVETFIKGLEGTTNVNKSVKEGTGKLVFVPDVEKMKQYGVTEGQLFPWMRTLASGFTLDDVNFNDQERDVTLRMFEDQATPEDLGLLQIPVMGNPEQSFVTLSDLGTIQMKPSPTVISRENGKRSITVTASVMVGYLPTELNEDLVAYADGDLNLDQGYSWKIGGANEENQKSMQSVVNAMGISAILILITMVIQLGSFRKALIVMLVIPLSVSGVFIWFALTNTPISFPALIGMLSLFGIVIANSLMIVDKVNQNVAAGFTMREAIIDASASRLEPIALTSISQIIGLIPITLSDPMWRGMGGAIIAGLSFSGILMLFFIPVVYYYLYPEE